MLDLQLQQVGNDLLTGLNDLVEIDFRQNPCIDVFANAPETIAALKRDLSVSCPPLMTTTTTTDFPDVCLAPCVELIHEVEAKASELLEHKLNQDKEIAELKSENVKQQETNSMLLQVNSMFEARIVELEMQMRELASNSCS